MSERALLARAQAGDELAFARLLRRHQRLLEFEAQRFFFPGADGDDVLQEARIGFAKAVRAYRPERGASFGSFAALCVSRRLAGALTAARRVKHLTLSEATRGEAAERAWGALRERQGPHERLLGAERAEELREAAAELSALERDVFAHSLVGWSTNDAARRLGLAPKSADNALQRARGKLEDWYERQAA
ncbi:MAG: sigma-70 family RNA polymerase sigma factor [Actinomycetota bacterium]|nr:sigma-70 family RNA polymerase sigma factor [Actinomycetota bacterium]